MDMEKVIKGLEKTEIMLKQAVDRGGEMAVMGAFKCLNSVTDALAMLKDQEAKPMIENERGWNCPACGIRLIGKTASGYPCDLIDLPLNFCPRCGQEVKCE